MKTISQTGLSLIKRFEGCYLTAYDDFQPHLILKPNTPIKGTLTIGWGHTGGVYIGQSITQEEADSWLLKDLAKYIQPVNNPYYVPLTSSLNQNQFDALVSFCYNCGPGSLKKLCAPDRTLSTISEKLLAYNKSKGLELVGLTNRRKAEQKLFNTPMEDYKMNKDLEKKIESLTMDVLELASIVSVLKDRLQQIPAPQWIIEEFPDAPDALSQRTGTYDFWRSYLLILRNNTK